MKTEVKMLHIDGECMHTYGKTYGGCVNIIPEREMINKGRCEKLLVGVIKIG